MLRQCKLWTRNLFAYKFFCSDSPLCARAKEKRKLPELPSIGSICINRANTYTEPTFNFCYGKTSMGRLRKRTHTHNIHNHSINNFVEFHSMLFCTFSYPFFIIRIEWIDDGKKFTYFTFQWKVGNFSMRIK